MKKDELLNSLKTIIPSAKLPSQIDFEIYSDCLKIRISGSGVIANMQEDQSAFEGWAIVIKAAFPNIKKVILDWEDPKFKLDKKNSQEAHYNRFVMRAANFKKGYDWFDVAECRKVEVDNMQNLLDSKTIVVNFPKTPIRSVVNKTKKPEAYIERELVKLWSKNVPVTDEQLPVGLFAEIIAKDTNITPRGASQIDLWQLDENTMYIYELKVKDNNHIGIISELMFYVCTIQNIVNGLIKYPDLTKVKSIRHFKDFANAVKDNKICFVKGYLTASKFHPLIESHELKATIIEILNNNNFRILFDYKNISNFNF